MAQKKPEKDKARKEDKKKDGKKLKADKKKSASRPQPERSAEATGDTPKSMQLTHEDAMAMAEALVEMVNEGATDPVAFFVSADDPLGRELIRLQGDEMDDVEGVIPVVLDAAQVRRFGMLTIADEMIWRHRQNDDE